MAFQVRSRARTWARKVISGQSLPQCHVEPQRHDKNYENDEKNNAYFQREYCQDEMRWAKAAGVPIVPLIDIGDKPRIGEFVMAGPVDLHDILNIDFITLIDSDPEHWEVSVGKVSRALSPKVTSPESTRKLAASAAATQAESGRGSAYSSESSARSQRSVSAALHTTTSAAVPPPAKNLWHKQQQASSINKKADALEDWFPSKQKPKKRNSAQAW